MPKGTGQRQIGPRSAALRQIANRYRLFDYPVPYLYPKGSFSFVAPIAGKWLMVLWGGGGGGANGTSSGGSGALYLAIRDLRVGQSLALVVGAGQAASTITLPSGEVLTAGGANLDIAGAATANVLGDIAINGTAGSIATPAAGANAPTSGNFIGGPGGAVAANGISPGGGGGVAGASIGQGAPGLIILARSRD